MLIRLMLEKVQNQLMNAHDLKPCGGCFHTSQGDKCKRTQFLQKRKMKKILSRRCWKGL